MRRRAGLIVVLAVGCSSTTSTPVFDQPSLAPLTFQVSPEPAPGAGPVVRDAEFRIVFDDYPDPDSVEFGPILLRSGTASFDVDMTVDLVGKAVLVHPRSLLQPDTQYELVVSNKMRGLSGRAVPSAMVAPISVGEALNPSPPPVPPQLTWTTDVAPLLSVCAPYCHTPDRCPGRMPPRRNPSRNLDLSGDPADPVLGLINVPSVALAGSDHPLNRVTPGHSAQSVLLRKLLGGDPHADSADPPTDDLAVPGRRMPLYESVCGEALPPPADFYLDETRLRIVQSWIDEGAAP